MVQTPCLSCGQITVAAEIFVGHEILFQLGKWGQRVGGMGGGGGGVRKQKISDDMISIAVILLTLLQILSKVLG